MKNSEINEDSTYRNKDMIKLAEEAKDKYFVLKTKPKPKKTQKKKEKESVSDSS